MNELQARRALVKFTRSVTFFNSKVFSRVLEGFISPVHVDEEHKG